MSSDGPPAGGQHEPDAELDKTACRTRRLRQAIIRVCRRLTAEHGLAGFTVEQVCEEVGVSRRTFFNHFATKEDAVLGIELGEDDALFHAFAAGEIVAPELPPLDAVIALAAEYLGHVGVDRKQEGMLRAALYREPALLTRFVSAGDRRMRRFIDLIRERQRYGADDPRPRLIANLAAAILKAAAEEFFTDPASPPFEHLIHRNLRLAKQALQPTSQEIPV